MKVLRADSALQVNSDSPDYLSNYTALMLKVPLVNNRSAYRLNIFPDASTLQPNEIRLNRNDVFAVTDIGLFISQFNPTSGNHGNYPLVSFPDPGIFLGVPGSGLKEWECLESLYNGQLFLKQQSVDRTTTIPTNFMRFVPERAFTTSGSTPTQGNVEDSLFELERMVILSGQDDNTIELSTANNADLGALQGGLTAAGAAAATRNMLTIFLGGVLYRNMAAAALRDRQY
jgi:hypothetical protein